MHSLRKIALWGLHLSLLMIFVGYVITLLTSIQGEFLTDDGMGGMVVCKVNYDPYGKPIVFTAFAVFIVSAMLLLKRIQWKVLALALALAGVYFVLRYCLREVPPMLQSPWLYFHVTIIMAAYALFLLLAILPLVGGDRRGLISIINQWGVTLLGIGIILGSIWASESWGSYWSWDPKETWALITFIVYALPMHKKIVCKIADWQFYKLYYLFALLFVLMTYFGVNFVLGGMHSYM